MDSNSSSHLISPDSIVVAGQDQVSCDLEGEAAILNLKDGVYYGLDPVGASVWKLVQQPRRVTEICDAIVGEFEVDADRCASDLVALLSELATLGLVEITNS